MTLYSGFTKTKPGPVSKAANRKFRTAQDVRRLPDGDRHAVRDDDDHPICDTSLRIVVKLLPFAPQVGGMQLRTCPRCAQLVAAEDGA